MLYQPEIVLVLVGSMMCLIGFMLWRNSVMRRRISKQDPLRDLQRELERKENSPESLIHHMETRLFDYGREVEGRVETTLSVLDRLILDADREIGRLEELLEVSRERTEKASHAIPLEKMGPVQTERIPKLLVAGLSDEEIARCLDCSVQMVVEYRKQFDNDQQADAA